MADLLRMAAWSPYAAGAGIGVLSWLAFLLSDRPLACSTSFARTGGMLERLLGGKPGEREYYRKFTPEIDWQWMLVAGVFTGALLSSVLSGEFQLSSVPALWAATFSGSWLARYAVSFGGGLLLGLGSRWAGGCTSGHGISGTLQLTLSSWLAVAVFFASGILFAWLLYGGGSC